MTSSRPRAGSALDRSASSASASLEVVADGPRCSAASPGRATPAVRGRSQQHAVGPGSVGWPDPTIVERVRARLAAVGAEPTPARVAAALRAEGRMLGDSVVLSVVGALRSELAGAGPLETLLADPLVTDVLVNSPAQTWVDRGEGLQLSDVRFADEAAVRRLAQRMAAAAGRRLDDAAPFVDARLPGGVRLHAVIPPVSPGGTLISLRTSRTATFTLDQLVDAGSVTEHGAETLRALVAAKLSFLVTGGTGSGKTTLLSVLLGLVPAAQRVVLVEDSGELRPDHPHVVRLEARPANVEGAGAVELRDLVRQALRMRPDRLVVGEVRGGEVVDLLAAMNTGHAGGCGTVHANRAGDLPARIEALGVAAGLGRAAVHSQLVAGVDMVVHLDIGPGGVRRVAELGCLEADPHGLVSVTPAWHRDLSGRWLRGPAADRLARRLGRSAADPGATRC